MPYLFSIQQNNVARVMTDTFKGYNRHLKIEDGEFYDSLNLTTDYYPLMATRAKRSQLVTLSRGQGLLGKRQLAYVDSGTLYYGGLATPVTGLAAGEKQLVSMGACICVFPDKVYYNTENGNDYGSMEAFYHSKTPTGTIRYEASLSDGTLIGAHTVSSREPETPEDGDLWVNENDGNYYEYRESRAEWVIVGTVYTKITFATAGQLHFADYDGVTVSGARYDCLNGSKIIYSSGGSSADSIADYVVVIGIIPENHVDSAGYIEISRTVPAMDFVCECQNRLWGCYYGYSPNYGVINEIYCSALGDFKNWSQYLNVSTDSWTASVGSDGEWTGCINYLGYPTFFKENIIHKVVVSASGGHQIAETPCRGVQKGSHKSLQIVGETLYYKSRTDVCAWQGGFPVTVSEKLGDEEYFNAVGGVFGTKYFIKLQDADNEPNLFVYDTAKRLWIREDDLNVVQFATTPDSLYAMVAETAQGEGYILDLNGKAGTREASFPWSAESGILYYADPNQKYIQRYDIRLKCAGKVDVFLEYDSSGEWIPSGTFAFTGINSVIIPIRPRRCDHLRMKLAGNAEVKIFSIARIYESGSDYL